MKRTPQHHFSWKPALRLWVFACLIFLLSATSPARAHERDELPNPLRLEDVLAYGRAHRQEIVSARARARAAGEKPAIVSALEDPMVMVSIDHLPFMLHGIDASLMVEQRFPLSGVLARRRRAAEADASRFRAESVRRAKHSPLNTASSRNRPGTTTCSGAWFAAPRI
jgi:cobalt-zinc-cadmium efflux system outer membrane protein